jgi:KaiC/GvpD/RAD55 family RecA-like ATPase
VSNIDTMATTPARPPAAQRATTGVPGLDALVGGGFPGGRAVLVCGAPGTGKTTLAMQFLAAGIAGGTPGVMVTVDQKARHVVEDAGRFGWDFDGAMQKKALAILDPAPYFTAGREPGKRLEARQLTAELARRTRELGAGRLVIDSLASLLPAGTPPDDTRDFLRTLVFAIEDNLGCATVLTWSDHGRGDGAALTAQAQAETLASGIVDLQTVRTNDGRYHRRLVVRKMRGTAAEPQERAYSIRPGIGLTLEGR